MSGKADFSVDEWDLLRSSPLMASMLVVAASPSGPVGLVQESTAAAKTIMQSVGAAQTPLLKTLSEDVTQTMAIPKPPPGATPRPGTGGCGGDPKKDLGIALHQGHA
jgi:hypothetical protein